MGMTSDMALNISGTSAANVQQIFCTNADIYARGSYRLIKICKTINRLGSTTNNNRQLLKYLIFGEVFFSFKVMRAPAVMEVIEGSAQTSVVIAFCTDKPYAIPLCFKEAFTQYKQAAMLSQAF